MTEETPKDWKAWLLASRPARYPLATLAILLALLALLWWLDPDFLRFLGSAGSGAPAVAPAPESWLPDAGPTPS